MALRATHIPTNAREREIFISPYLPKDIPYKTTVEAPQQHSLHSLNHVVSAYPSPMSQRLMTSLSQPKETIAYLFHLLLFTLIHLTFTVYITLRYLYNAALSQTLSVAYHHHRTPELIARDVRGLSRLPKHLSILLELDTRIVTSNGGTDDRLTKLIADAAEVSAWTASAGIPMLSIYERTGALKAALPELYEQLFETFGAYYSPGTEPEVHLRAPHLSAFKPTTNGHGSHALPTRPSLDVLLLSESDGRDTLVDLTKTLAEMAQAGRLQPHDVTQELIDAEMTAASCGEPDLLVIMAGRGDSTELKLRGYPCWQVRLTEIFHSPDSAGADYQLFLRALFRYAKAQMRFGS